MNLQGSTFCDSLSAQLQQVSDVFESALFIRQGAVTRALISAGEAKLKKDIARLEKIIDILEKAAANVIELYSDAIDQLGTMSEAQWKKIFEPLVNGIEGVMRIFSYFGDTLEIQQKQQLKSLENKGNMQDSFTEEQRRLLRQMYVAEGIITDTYKALMRLRLAALVEQADRERDKASPVFSNPRDLMKFLKNA